VPIVLAANKCDIGDPLREVGTDEGCALANEWCVPYIETSAKNSTIVNSLFTEIVKEMNIKSSMYGNSNRKEKKKFKKINYINTNTNSSTNNILNNTNKTTLSNHSASSYMSSKESSSASTKFKKRNSNDEGCCMSCGFYNFLPCFCCGIRSLNCEESSEKSSYSNESHKRTCSIL
jgi:hypothetical protein